MVSNTEKIILNADIFLARILNWTLPLGVTDTIEIKLKGQYIIIKNYKVTGQFNCRGTINRPYIKFVNCDFDDVIFNLHRLSTLSFEKCTFQSVLIEQVDLNELEFEECEIAQNLIIESKGILSNIVLNETKGKGVLRITVEGSSQLFQMKGWCYFPNIHLTYVDLESLELVGKEKRWVMSNNLEIYGTVKSITLSFTAFEDCFIHAVSDHIVIAFTEISRNLNFGEQLIQAMYLLEVKGDGKVSYSNENLKLFSAQSCNFRHLSFGKDSFVQKFQVENSSVKDSTFEQLTFWGIAVKSIFVIDNCTVSKSLELNRADLGSAEIIWCKFQGSTIFYSSNIRDAFLVRTDFPKIVRAPNGKIDFHDAQMFFGQLQYAYTKLGDSIRSTDYKALELEAYYASLGNKKPFTKFSLFLNAFSNDFGRSWILGIVFTLGFGLQFFTFLLWSIPEYRDITSWDADLFGSFLHFINPLRQFNLKELFNANLHFSRWSYVWDFLGRIFVAYGYYQTIQAFRRFGKQ